MVIPAEVFEERTPDKHAKIVKHGHIESQKWAHEGRERECLFANHVCG